MVLMECSNPSVVLLYVQTRTVLAQLEVTRWD